jgi:hypothetical protein
MARSGYITLTTAQEEAYFTALKSGDRFIAPRITKQINLFSYRRKKGVSQRSLLPLCASIWNTYTTEQKTAWNTAGSYTGLTGWKLFVKDKCYREVNGMAGEATPNNYHQALVGLLHIDAPADEIKIFQPHPSAYYISHKITGFKGMYSPLLVSERLTLPLVLSISYKSDLTSTGAGSFAKFYAIVRRLYQGNNLEQLLEINLDLSTDWKTATATLSTVLGQYTSYSLYIHLYKMTGDLFFDNIKATHNSANWARDKDCNDINQVFTRAFYQVPKNWASLVLPATAYYESVYPT